MNFHFSPPFAFLNAHVGNITTLSLNVSSYVGGKYDHRSAYLQ